MYLGLPASWQCFMPAGQSLSETPGPLSFLAGSLLSRGKEEVRLFLFLTQNPATIKDAAFPSLQHLGRAGLLSGLGLGPEDEDSAFCTPRRVSGVGPRCIPQSSALLCRMPAKPAASVAQLAQLPRTKLACLINGLFLFVSIMLNTPSSCPQCRSSPVLSSVETSSILQTLCF